MSDHQSLYERTGRVEDINTVLVPRQDLRRLHAEVEQLREQLEAIGAGGVEPLRKRGCLHQIQEAA